jgi:hypothetical protein
MTTPVQIPSLPSYEISLVVGSNISKNWYFFFGAISQLFSSGFTGTIATAKLTGGGANGSITFVNGVVTAQKQAT